MEQLAASTVESGRMRFGERARRWLRRERVFDSGGGWYFRTREGIDVGPYKTRFEAEVESDILAVRLAEDASLPALRVIRTFMLESVREYPTSQDHGDIGELLIGNR
jgi:Domain of unknown function (DUF6316)